MLLASAGVTVPLITGLLIGLVWIAFRRSGTVCRHCGHDSGIPVWRARVCPECGRRRDRRIGKSR